MCEGASLLCMEVFHEHIHYHLALYFVTMWRFNRVLVSASYSCASIWAILCDAMSSTHPSGVSCHTD